MIHSLLRGKHESVVAEQTEVFRVVIFAAFIGVGVQIRKEDIGHSFDSHRREIVASQ